MSTTTTPTPTPLQSLNREINARNDRYWEEELLACANHRAILVEGDDDKDIVEVLLDRQDPSWSTRVRVVVAGSRTKVLRRLLSTFPTGVGLLDRDTWSDAEVDSVSAPYAGRLHVTAGWCLESSLLAARLPGEEPDLEHALELVREDWLRAGALWWTLQRTREAFNTWQESLGWTYGALRTDLDLRDGPALKASLQARIPAAVCAASRLDLDEIGQTYEQRLEELLNQTVAEQWSLGIHGKRAFVDVLVPWLNRRHGQREPHAWRKHRARSLTAAPAPLDRMLQQVL